MAKSREAKLRERFTTSSVRPVCKRVVQKQLVSVRHGTTVNELMEEQTKGGGSLQQRAAVRSVSGNVAPHAPVFTESRFAHDFSRVPAHTSALQTRQVIQSKLTVNTPGDRYEQEADRVAGAVMRMPAPSRALLFGDKGGLPAISRVQASSEGVGTVSSDVIERIGHMRGNGQVLPDTERSFFKERMGYDFGSVRVHTDANAVQTCRDLNARAFTVGHDIVFNAGEYRPGTDAGRRLLAHELTHVVQQKQGQLRRQSVIQRWGPSDHKDLTLEGVKKYFSFFEGFDLDERAAKTLAQNAAQMDTKWPELWFNFGGKIKGSFLGGINKKKRHGKLVEYYRAHPERARNHGEGGLYYMTSSSAAAVNRKQQDRYLKEAQSAYRKLLREFTSYDDCRATKTSVKQKVLSDLGDALHVAQDRGSHGEGAAGQGHAREIFTGKSPDKKTNNVRGHEWAQRHTEMILLLAHDMLYRILNKRYETTCSYTSPAEVKSVRD